MSDTRPFDMPPESASFEARGGWLVDQFMAEPFLGFTNIIHPAAIVGNLGGESGLRAINEIRPLIPGSRGGWGWAQWTGPRRVQFENYCADQGYNYSSDEGQYKFLVWELLNTENHSLQQLKKTTELKAAVYTFCVQFERPADPEGGLPSRLRFAERALAFPRRQGSQPDETAPIAPLPAPTPEADDDLQKDVRRALEILIPEIVKTLQAVLKASGQAKSRGRQADLGSGVVLRNCPHCGQPFKAGPGGRRSDARFCSTEHQMAFKSLQRSRKGSAK